MTLDLHGFHVDEAIAAMKRVIEEKEQGNFTSSCVCAFTRLGHECQDLLSPCDGMHVSTDWISVYTLIQKSSFRVNMCHSGFGQ